MLTFLEKRWDINFEDSRIKKIDLLQLSFLESEGSAEDNE